MVKRGAALIPCLLAGIASALPGQQRGLRAGESDVEVEFDEVFPGAEPEDASGDNTVWCWQIFDAVDRRPLPGALVMVPWHPGGGVVDAELHHRSVGVADDHGWVRLPAPAVVGWRDYVFAEAPGYASDEHCGPGMDWLALLRGIDVPVELIDYTGRPVPNARIELVLGCGHVPPQRSVVADANGRATLRAIDPRRHEDFCVWAPGWIYGHYRLRHSWRAGDPPVPIDVVPGRTASGRVVDADGKPVPGVRVGPVGEFGEHHRPWARTDRDGRFHLVGLDAWQDLKVDPPAHLALGTKYIMAPASDGFCTVVLGATEVDCDVVVKAATAAGEPADDLRIVATRTTDGLTFTELTDALGEAHLDLPPGIYVLHGDGELGRFGRSQRELVVAADRTTIAPLVVPKNPTVLVDTKQIDHMNFGITTATRFRELATSPTELLEIPIPVDERATFRISHQDDGDLVVRFVEIPGPGQTMVLEGPPVTKVRARFVGPDGKPVPASLRLERAVANDSLASQPDEDAAPTAELETSRVGTLTWVASPQDERLAMRLGDLVAGRGDLDLGEIRFEVQNAPELTVVLPDELKEEGGSVEGYRADGVRRPRDGFGEDGVIANGFGDFVAGDVLWVEPRTEGAMPFPFVVPGPPPWTVTYPTTSLTLTMRSAAGLPATYPKVFVDGTQVAWNREDEPELRLLGLAPGEHTLVVAERAHLARRLRITIGADEQRALEVQLNQRPQ